MDDYFFKGHVDNCRNVTEDTSYLEIFNYSVWLLAARYKNPPAPAAAAAAAAAKVKVNVTLGLQLRLIRIRLITRWNNIR